MATPRKRKRPHRILWRLTSRGYTVIVKAGNGRIVDDNEQPHKSLEYALGKLRDKYPAAIIAERKDRPRKSSRR